MDRRKNRSKASASAAARQAFKEGRGGRLDDYVVPEEDDIYDVLEEEEYEKLVESRRQREDFVVDDGA
jgi:DNA polymerase alpha subunit p180 N terminal